MKRKGPIAAAGKVVRQDPRDLTRQYSTLPGSVYHKRANQWRKGNQRYDPSLESRRSRRSQSVEPGNPRPFETYPNKRGSGPHERVPMEKASKSRKSRKSDTLGSTQASIHSTMEPNKPGRGPATRRDLQQWGWQSQPVGWGARHPEKKVKLRPASAEFRGGVDRRAPARDATELKLMRTGGASYGEIARMKVSREGETITCHAERVPRNHLYTSTGYNRLLRDEAAHLGIVKGKSVGRQPKLLLKSFTGITMHPPSDFPDSRAYCRKFGVGCNGIFS